MPALDHGHRANAGQSSVMPGDATARRQLRCGTEDGISGARPCRAVMPGSGAGSGSTTPPSRGARGRRCTSAEDWDVGPGETCSFPTKWMSADGKTVYLVFSGDDCFSVRRADLTVAE